MANVAFSIPFVVFSGSRMVGRGACLSTALRNSNISLGSSIKPLTFSVTARRWSSSDKKDHLPPHPLPTTSSSGHPSPLSNEDKSTPMGTSSSTKTMESTSTIAGKAAKEQAPRLKKLQEQQQAAKGSKAPYSTTATAKPAVTQASEVEETATMDWNSYFQLRRTRRNYERAFMVPCALLSTVSAGYYFAQQDFDPTPIFGMDQVVVYGLGTVAAGVVGLAMGPVVGNIAFRMNHAKAKPLVDSMDKEFRKHIVKNRADPSTNSVTSPLPDYEGEKIKSVSDYRKWLRKQREHRRKATFFV
ncbi:TIM23 complex component [Lobosporangium transversale]|uniref:Presequence translocated-associated motor subunit PAM17 n=1 Tax=Lobosporangium transversale TaxID=64571 RepID=A0A1Y2G657_9FUNG|nr:mitochondrial import protein Pam17-domain-containing protein [Lobosporangium transversale]KAF9912750.1 TIM23 complex component [Lobosporangium transversale]ORY97100.1 mitochondrial import protein Pam17-domain-containing protein [Lobosporangium transversale]|eukprot:XP_021875633.1 mitochondrial import protein Pam17-domain-containing protein [Lobosporangium transversale]